jgi:hypothetical protein
MPSHIHHDNVRWLAYIRDGDQEWTHNLTAWVGYDDQYRERVAVLRSQLGPGQTLDTTEADAQHERMTEARRLWRAAYAWWQEDTLNRPHPGSLEEYVP